jgi:hypothetical protein
LLTVLLVLQKDDEPFQITLSDESFETYELDPPPYTMEVTKAELKQMYYDMVSIRYARLPMQHQIAYSELLDLSA